MNEELKLLYIEDDRENRESLVKLLHNETLCNFNVDIEAVDTFDHAIDKISSTLYHIIILDIYKGDPINGGEQSGLQILEQIQSKCFIPVIFYSCTGFKISDCRSCH